MPMRTTISYTIKDISEDKTMVIVGMEGNFEFNTPNLPEGISMEMKTSEISGWILIDISRGISLQSSTASLIELMTSQMGQSFDMILKTNAKMNLK